DKEIWPATAGLTGHETDKDFEISRLSPKEASDVPTQADMARNTKFTFKVNLDVTNHHVDVPPAPLPPAVRSEKNPPVRKKLTDFWSIESPEEQAEWMARELERDCQIFEARALAETREKLQHLHQKRADERERQRLHRERVWDEKVAAGWVPGQKRVSRADV